MRRTLYIAILSVVFVSSLKGQDSIRTREHYVQTLDHLMALELNVNTSYERFLVDATDFTLNIHPNAKTQTGIRMNYRFLSLEFTVAPNFIPGNDDEKKKGETKTFQLGTSLVFDHWVSALYYQKIKGYYIKNSSDLGVWEAGDPYFQLPDLEYSGIQFSLGYSTNERFSFASLFSQTERQLLSAGSFIPNLELRYYTIDTTTEEIGTQKSKNTEITAGPGYAYTYVFNSSYFVSLVGKTGVGYQHIRLQTRTEPSDIFSTQENFLFRWEGAIGLGFNGERFYTGIYGVLNGAEYQQENTTVRNTQTSVYYRAFIGYRFNAPKLVKKAVDFVETLIPLKN